MSEIKNPDPKAYPGYGRYPELNYAGMDHHRASWVNHIVRHLEDNTNEKNWHHVLLKGTMDFGGGWSATDQENYENIKRRLPNLRIIQIKGKTFWVRDEEAHKRMFNILTIERSEARGYAESITLAMEDGIPPDTDPQTYEATKRVLKRWREAYEIKGDTSFVKQLLDAAERMANNALRKEGNT